MRLPLLAACVLCIAALEAGDVAIAAVPQRAPGLLRKIHAVHAGLEVAWSDSSTPLGERADIALRLGHFGEATQLWEELRRESPDKPDAAMAEIYMKRYNFKAAEKLIQQNLRREPRNESFLWLYFELLVGQENLPELDSLTAHLLAENPDLVPALLARGSLHYHLLDYDSAAYYNDRAMQKAPTARWQALAVMGISAVKYKQREDQAALDTLLAILSDQTFSDRFLFALCQPLIRLGRVREATRVLEKALAVNPYHERAHYYLGNGFTRFSYTQLEEKYPHIFAGNEGEKALTNAKYLLQTGEIGAAETQLLQMSNEHPSWVQPLTILGSIAWTREEFEKGRQYFEEALAICPHWGRAHNGYAKAMEGKRMRVSIYRREDWQAFDAQLTPEIPRIGQFVVNWSSLSPRHQKQVALSIAPWRAFVSVLVESGCTYYIKPLYRRLSACPGLETLQDLRISYDSRLWDDVRGCGGFNTVTGVEDVERTIYRHYNTVLHELTHQVHGLLTPDEQNLIQETYRRAKAREQAGPKTFMSRYQASSVWEYFAEGANAYWSPERNRYDTREITRERLFELDTALVHLVEHFMAIEDDEPYYVIGLVNAAQDNLEKGHADDALAIAQKAYAHDRAALPVLAMLSHIYSILGHHDLAVGFAETLKVCHPTRSKTYIRLAEAYFHKTGDKQKACQHLLEGLPKLASQEASELHLELGRALRRAGDYEESARYFTKMLDYQSDKSDALWGMALALGDGGKRELAKDYFRAALARRTGIVELRLDYARFLLQGGDIVQARREIAEAQLLDPDGDDVLTFAGWLDALAGRWPQALRRYEEALEIAPHNDLAKILKLEALRAMNRADAAKALEKELQRASKHPKPAWVYSCRLADYKTVHDWPEWQVELLETVLRR